MIHFYYLLLVNVLLQMCSRNNSCQRTGCKIAKSAANRLQRRCRRRPKPCERLQSVFSHLYYNLIQMAFSTFCLLICGTKFVPVKKLAYGKNIIGNSHIVFFAADSSTHIVLFTQEESMQLHNGDIFVYMSTPLRAEAARRISALQAVAIANLQPCTC